MTKTVTPLQLSIGGWCLTNGGTTPFSDERARNFDTEQALRILAGSGADIKQVSFHDGDLWGADATSADISRRIAGVKKLCDELGLGVYNFTTNLFSDIGFRSGSHGSPIPAVRMAAIAKDCGGVMAAKEFGAKHMIHWLGSDGHDGAYEQDPRVALLRIASGLSVVAQFGLENGCPSLIHTIEPKQYEPRKKSLYTDSGATAAAMILSLIPHWLRNYFRINPEYPQHVTMLSGDPVNELALLLATGMIAPFIHFGGQVSGRMDCDSEPGFGGDYYTDFMIRLNLHRANWNGVVEFDCRPERTTTSAEGLSGFLVGCVDYWRTLEAKVREYLEDEEIQQLEAELDQTPPTELLALAAAVDSKGCVTEALNNMMAKFSGFSSARSADTNMIQTYARRVKKILLGVA